MLGQEEEDVFRLATVGSGSVGKSALVLRWIHDQFDTTEEYVPTIEDSYDHCVEIDGKGVDVQILDTAGQEEYEALRERYMRDEEGFLLVYSLTDQNSAVELHQFRDHILRLKRVRKCPMVVVGNKCDLEARRQVDMREMQQQCKIWQIPFMESSAKDGVNVDRCWEALIREVRSYRDEIESGVDHHDESILPLPPTGVTKKKFRCSLM